MGQLSVPSASHHPNEPAHTPPASPQPHPASRVKVFNRTTYKQAESDSENERPSTTSPASSSDQNTTKIPPYDRSLLPGGSRSLSLIAVQAFALGIVLATSTSLAILSLSHSNSIWRIPAFFACLSIFHFLEFWTTAHYNVPNARASSFLLWSNKEYNYAHAMAMTEILLLYTFFPSGQRWGSSETAMLANKIIVSLGVGFVLLGQVVRSAAMITAGTNFNHVPARDHKEGHELVTTGIYARLRHPSYFGFFWWAVGTQLVVGNKVCLLGYGVVLWRFFRSRIVAEEQYLYSFFGNDYTNYRDRVGTGIPFIR